MTNDKQVIFIDLGQWFVKTKILYNSPLPRRSTEKIAICEGSFVRKSNESLFWEEMQFTLTPETKVTEIYFEDCIVLCTCRIAMRA